MNLLGDYSLATFLLTEINKLIYGGHVFEACPLTLFVVCSWKHFVSVVTTSSSERTTAQIDLKIH